MTRKAIFLTHCIGVLLISAATSGLAQEAYQMTAKELKLNCKQLTGTIRVRLMQLNAAKSGDSGTAVARGLQSGATKIFGGPSYGTSPDSDTARDRAQIEAYNRQLVAKKCKPVNLQNPDAR